MTLVIGSRHAIDDSRLLMARITKLLKADSRPHTWRPPAPLEATACPGQDRIDHCCGFSTDRDRRNSLTPNRLTTNPDDGLKGAHPTRHMELTARAVEARAQSLELLKAVELALVRRSRRHGLLEAAPAADASRSLLAALAGRPRRRRFPLLLQYFRPIAEGLRRNDRLSSVAS
jgi:hypothetical protein